MVLEVVNPANRMTLQYGNATRCVPVTQTVWATINLAGLACVIPPEAIIPTVVGECLQMLKELIAVVFFVKYASHASEAGCNGTLAFIGFIRCCFVRSYLATNSIQLIQVDQHHKFVK